MLQGVEVVEIQDNEIVVRNTIRRELIKSQENAKIKHKFDLSYFREGYPYYVQRFNEEYPTLYFCHGVSEQVIHLVKPSDREETLDKAEFVDILIGEAVRENIIFTIAVPSDISIRIED